MLRAHLSSSLRSTKHEIKKFGDYKLQGCGWKGNVEVTQCKIEDHAVVSRRKSCRKFRTKPWERMQRKRERKRELIWSDWSINQIKLKKNMLSRTRGLSSLVGTSAISQGLIVSRMLTAGVYWLVLNTSWVSEAGFFFGCLQFYNTFCRNLMFYQGCVDFLPPQYVQKPVLYAVMLQATQNVSDLNMFHN